MGIIGTAVGAGKTIGKTIGNVIDTVKDYKKKKIDQALKANQKSAILNKPKTAPTPEQQNNRAKLKEMGFAPNPRQGQEKRQIMTGKKPIEFNPANKGAFAKSKAETKSAPAPVEQKNQPNNLLKKNLNQKKMVEQAKQNVQQKQEKIHKNQSLLKGWSVGSEINDPKKRNAYINDIKKVYGSKPTQQMADRLNEDSSLMNWPEQFVKDLTPEQQARRLKLMNTYGFSPKPQN